MAWSKFPPAWWPANWWPTQPSAPRVELEGHIQAVSALTGSISSPNTLAGSIVSISSVSLSFQKIRTPEYTEGDIIHAFNIDQTSEGVFTLTLKPGYSLSAGNIIESGSNANGSYRKFADGTLEAWGSFGITMLNGLQQYNGFPYQVAFADLPIVLYIVFNPALSWDFILRGAYDSSNVPSFTLQYFNATTQLASIKYHALGRWRI